MSKATHGSCLCGSTAYEVSGNLRPVCVCHCTQCRKSSGHYVAATQCMMTDLKIHGESLIWFKSSDIAERGFCGTCGSNLFWRRAGADHMSIFSGTIDGETGLSIASQLNVESKGDYYTLPDVPVISQDMLVPI